MNGTFDPKAMPFDGGYALVRADADPSRESLLKKLKVAIAARDKGQVQEIQKQLDKLVASQKDYSFSRKDAEDRTGKAIKVGDKVGTATRNGVVTAVDGESIKVKFDDGTSKNYKAKDLVVHR